jgi:hypothetical protein
LCFEWRLINEKAISDWTCCDRDYDTRRYAIYQKRQCMRKVDAQEYIPILRELTEQGKGVALLISGSSMSPFLAHERDTIYFKKPDRELRRGDMVFYQRASGQFVMHRIWKVKPEGYYMVGDAQQEIEGPLKREQIFGLITKVKRKDKWIKAGDFWWEFFEHIWIRIVPFRRIIRGVYGRTSRLLRRGKQ